MTPDEDAKLAKQKRIARTPELAVERREPLDGQGELFGERRGWSLITSRPLTPEQSAAADERARVELGQAKGKAKRPRKREGDGR